MYASILNVTFDCADAKAQAEFWAAVTGWDLHEQDGASGHAEYAVAAPSPRHRSSALRLRLSSAW